MTLPATQGESLGRDELEIINDLLSYSSTLSSQLLALRAVAGSVESAARTQLKRRVAQYVVTIAMFADELCDQVEIVPPVS